MKRFYKVVSTARVSDGSDENYHILLDGKPIKTPLRLDLKAPNEAIANLVMQEWADAPEEINPAEMRFTQILSTYQDKVSVERAEMTAQILNYLNTDLICYFAPQDDFGTPARQETLWRPWLNWFKEHFGVSLRVTCEIAALEQPEAAEKAVKDHVAALNDHQFTVLQMVVPACGSLVLGLAFVEQRIKPSDLLAAIRIEEMIKNEVYNADKHGPDPAQEKKDGALIKDFDAMQKFLANL